MLSSTKYVITGRCWHAPDRDQSAKQPLAICLKNTRENTNKSGQRQVAGWVSEGQATGR